MKTLLQQFKRLNILVVGDVMVDEYIWGKVDRISPEAPVPVLAVNRRESRMGGAANVALNTTALGINTILCGVIGTDAQAKSFLNMMKNANISHQAIVQVENRPTTTKTRIIAQHQHVLRVDDETIEQIDALTQQKVLERIDDVLSQSKIDAIILQDYDKGLMDEFLIESIVTKANKQGIPTIVDPKKRNFFAYKNVTLFKPNLKEFKEGLKMDFNANNIEELKLAVAQLRKRINAENIMVTLSELGVFISTPNEDKLIPAHIRTIADVSGAGDTVVSVVSACLALKKHPFFVAAMGNLAGGLVCEQVGVVPINKETLIKEAIHYNL